jgi:hypothetical protein
LYSPFLTRPPLHCTWSFVLPFLTRPPLHCTWGFVLPLSYPTSPSLCLEFCYYSPRA